MVKGNEFATETLSEVNEGFKKDDDAQRDLRTFFSAEPASLRAIEEREEFANAGIVKRDGVMIDEETQTPVDFEKGQNVLKIVEERMLTEGNPMMIEFGFEYVGMKIIRKMVT